MTDFKSFMEAEAANDIAALGGETVTHTPDGASGESVSAIIDREERVRDDRPSTDADVRRATLHVASAAITAPTLRSAFTFDSLTWSVDGEGGITGPNLGMYVVHVTADAALARRQSGHRAEV